MESPRQTLTEACAPVFLFLTTFRRNSATSPMSIEALRTALIREVEEVRRRCEADRRLAPLFERMFYALCCSADQVILSSAWSQRAGWSMNLLERNYFKTSEGGARFFRVVDEVLADPSDAGAEMAELLFNCMAMGFQGELLGEARELERRRRQLFEKARLAGVMGELLTPDAYGRNAARDVLKLPTVGIVRLLLVAAAALAVALLLTFGAVSLNYAKQTAMAAELADAIETAAADAADRGATR